MLDISSLNPTGASLIPTLQVWLTGDIAPGIESTKAASNEPIYPGGLAPLHLLAQRGSVVLVRSAIEAGFAVDVRDDYHRTPLMVAAGLAGYAEAGAMAETFISAGAAVSATDRFGNSALHYAARSGNPEAFALLLVAGADPDSENRSGLSARAIAEGRADIELTRLLRRAEFHRDDAPCSGVARRTV
jgi:ankyrin repeat protein